MKKNKFGFKLLTENINPLHSQLREKVIDYNISKTGTYGKQEPLFCGYFDDQDNLIAGCYGYFFWGMFYIDLLWVDEKYRHQKLGSKLLEKVEEHAIKQKALYIRVNTATFQALDFYLKNGYEIFAKLPISVKGHSDQNNYYLIKYLK
jgi:ribosomal protein S18 acetylase RimI-like enzyme